MDKLGEWRAFVAVANSKSFSAAARNLGKSPQSMTRALAALEGRLRTRLLNRTTRSVSLTNDGERQLEAARRALAEFDRLESGESAAAPLQGRLSITAPVLFGQIHVLPLAVEFLAAHPRLDLRLLLLDRVVSLAEEGLDVAVRIGALPDSALRARVVGQVGAVLCASPAYLRKAGVPRTPQALSRHHCISFAEGASADSRWAFAGPGGREQRVSVRARLAVNTGQAAIDAALAGLGIARVLSYQVERLAAAKKLRLLLTSFEPRPAPIQLVHLPGPQTRPAAAFIEFAAARLRQRLSPAP
jgi:DNA-binding transcriptional LysR family regulator